MRIARYVVLGFLLATGAMLVAATGVIPIHASSGHWAVTSWILDAIKRRSVNTYSMAVDVPVLDDPMLAVRGAGHYERSCRPCHGSPAAARPPLVMRMTPHPPFLPERMHRWTAAELFQIVKHGIKFTGMPAWPAPQRDDEIWMVVAFLRRLSQMTAADYWRLAAGDVVHPGSAPAPLAVCASCHGADGAGRGGAYPILAQQSPNYMRRALEAYARGRRHSGIMGPIAAALDDRTREETITNYSSLSAPPMRAVTGDVARGETIATRGIPERRVPACLECHRPESERHPDYPNLRGQHAEYLLQQLQLFKSAARGGSQLAEIMQPIAMRLTPDEQAAVAAYFGGRP
jgi:cytochrome c553